MSTLQLTPAVSARLRSPAVIGATALLTVAVAALQDSVVAAVLRGLLILVLVPCALIDLEQRIIPNRITGPAALAALVLGLALDAGGEPRRLLWAAIAGGFILVTALAYPAGMGMGDVKLLAVMGLCLGRPVILALVLDIGRVVCRIVIGEKVIGHRFQMQANRALAAINLPAMAVDFLQVLHAVFRDHELFGRIGR